MDDGIYGILNICLVGDASVGKTNLCSQYVKGEFNEDSNPTIGAEFFQKVYFFEDKKINLKFWDTAGQERYRAIGRKFYEKAHAIIMVYDVTEESTFESLTTWLAEVKNKTPKDVKVLLIGNKIDLKAEKKVSSEEGQRFATSNGLFFMETSAKENINVSQAFEILIKEAVLTILNQQKKEDDENFGIARESVRTIHLESNTPQKKGCC